MTDHLSNATATAVPEAVNWQQMWHEQRQESDRLNALLAVSRNAALKPARANDRRPTVTAEHVKRSLGPLALLNMTRDDKCRSVHVDPASITDAGLRTLYGRGNDGKAAKDLNLSDPTKYRILRECALILGIYGA